MTPIFTGAQFDAAIALLTGARFKIGTFSQNMASTSDNVVSGVGFAPSAIILISAVAAAGQASVGLDNGGTKGACLTNNHNTTANAWIVNAADPANGNSIDIRPSGKSFTGRVTSTYANGFTVSWASSGSPTGTLYVTYLAFK